MKEIYYCETCMDYRWHQGTDDDLIKCSLCSTKRSLPCPHDLVEIDASGHSSCADCRVAFS